MRTIEEIDLAYRYLGNKTMLADWIVDVITSNVPRGAVVADPMCGTAAVSEALAIGGFSVIAADALCFPTIHAAARLLIKEEPAFEHFGGYSAVLQAINELDPQKGYFYREFGAEGQPANREKPRLYFSAENAAKIDAIREFIRKNYLTGNLSEHEHIVLLQNLLLAVNSVANISGTYGYFLSQLSKNALKSIELTPLSFINTPGDHKVIRGPVSITASLLQANAVYLDPPYTKRQYAGNYHILETIAREDEPDAVGDGGLRPWKEDASAFCYRRTAGTALNDVLSDLDVADVFLSYSEDGQIQPDEIIDILSNHGEVKLYQHRHTRYRSNGQARSDFIYEKLYHVHKG